MCMSVYSSWNCTSCLTGLWDGSAVWLRVSNLYTTTICMYIDRYYWILKLCIYTYVCINDLCTTLPVQSLDEHPAASIHSSSTAKLLSIAFEFCFQSHKICIPATILYTSATKTPFGSSTKAPPLHPYPLVERCCHRQTMTNLWPRVHPFL